MNIGYYDTHYFLYMNEIDLSARLIDKEYKIVYDENVIVYHCISFKNRLFKKNGFDIKRYDNEFWGMYYFLFTKFEYKYSIVAIIKLLFNRVIIVLVKGELLLFFKISEQLFLKEKYYPRTEIL